MTCPLPTSPTVCITQRHESDSESLVVHLGAGSTIMNHITISSTGLITMSFLDGELLPERASRTTDVRPSLKHLKHTFICVVPIASFCESLLDLVDRFYMGIADLYIKCNLVLFKFICHF